MDNTSMAKRMSWIFLSFLLGLILEIVPLPHWAVWCRPEWVFVILLFWVLLIPPRKGLLMAFCVGIVMDLLTGTLLGQHAVAFTFAVYILIKFHAQIKHFPMLQQVSMVFVFTLLILAIQYWVMEITGTPPENWGYWFPALTSAMIWPAFYVLLRDCHESLRSI